MFKTILNKFGLGPIDTNLANKANWTKAEKDAFWNALLSQEIKGVLQKENHQQYGKQYYYDFTTVDQTTWKIIQNFQNSQNWGNGALENKEIDWDNYHYKSYGISVQITNICRLDEQGFFFGTQNSFSFFPEAIVCGGGNVPVKPIDPVKPSVPLKPTIPITPTTNNTACPCDCEIVTKPKTFYYSKTCKTNDCFPVTVRTKKTVCDPVQTEKKLKFNCNEIKKLN